MGTQKNEKKNKKKTLKMDQKIQKNESDLKEIVLMRLPCRVVSEIL